MTTVVAADHDMIHDTCPHDLMIYNYNSIKITTLALFTIQQCSHSYIYKELLHLYAPVTLNFLLISNALFLLFQKKI